MLDDVELKHKLFIRDEVLGPILQFRLDARLCMYDK